MDKNAIFPFAAVGPIFFLLMIETGKYVQAGCSFLAFEMPYHESYVYVYMYIDCSGFIHIYTSTNAYYL